MSYYPSKKSDPPKGNRVIIVAFFVVLILILGVIVYFKYILKPLSKEEIAEDLAKKIIDTAAEVNQTGNRKEIRVELPSWIETIRIGGQLNTSPQASCYYILVRIVNSTADLQVNSTKDNIYIALSRDGNHTIELTGNADKTITWVVALEKQSTDFSGDGNPDPWIMVSATLS